MGNASQAMRKETKRLACHRQAKGFEKGAGDPAEKSEREKDDDRGGGGTHERSGEFVARRQHAFVSRALAAAEPAHDVFDHHDGVVDDQPDRRRHPAERHDVEAHVHDVEQEHGRGERGRHRQCGDQRDLPVAQENEEDDGGEHDADEDGVARAVFGGNDKIALVVPILICDVR